MLRRLWERIEPWLTRVGHADLLLVKTGVGSVILMAFSGAWTGFLAWWHQAAAYQVVLAAMAGMAAALLIANQSLKLIVSWKAPVSVSRQQARRLDRLNPQGVTLGGRTAVIISILAAAVIITGGIAASNWYSSWKKDLDGTFLFIVPGQIKVQFDNKEFPFGVNATIANPGSLSAVGGTHNHAFLYPEKELTAEEEDRVFRTVDAGVEEPKESGSYIFPHTSGHFFTFGDKRLTKEQWNDDIVSGKAKMYLLIEYRYLVDGYVKITEFCVFYQKIDFPSAHNCHGHNQWRWK